jgi:hypothetical protein
MAPITVYRGWRRRRCRQIVPELTVAAAEAAARKVLDPRVTAVLPLAETRAALGRARAALADAEKADTATWAATLRAGWTGHDLRRVGFEPPTRRGPGRPRVTSDTGCDASESTGESSPSSTTR